LDLMGKKLTASISLKALKGKRDLFKHSFEEIEGVRGRSPLTKANYTPPADINRWIEIQPRGNSTGIHLDSLTGDRTLVAIPRPHPALSS